MTRDRRTRLNAEVAEQYGATTGGRAPGRNARTDELTDGDEELVDEASEAEAPLADVKQDAKPKSVFELPYAGSDPSRTTSPSAPDDGQ